MAQAPFCNEVSRPLILGCDLSHEIRQELELRSRPGHVFWCDVHHYDGTMTAGLACEHQGKVAGVEARVTKIQAGRLSIGAMLEVLREVDVKAQAPRGLTGDPLGIASAEAFPRPC